jgi:hypothetical protein
MKTWISFIWPRNGTKFEITVMAAINFGSKEEENLCAK